ATKVRVASSPCWVLYSARMGTKAWEKAPSAKMRRSRLGSLKATKKASEATPAPKMRAMMVSRTKPSTRESMVMELTAARDLSRFMSDGCAGAGGECSGKPRRIVSRRSGGHASRRVARALDKASGHRHHSRPYLPASPVFEEFDGGQQPFRQETRPPG